MSAGLPRALAVAVALLAVGTGPALADGDTSPPVGTLTVEGGAGFTSDKVVVLDVPATDDLGVVTVRARVGAGAWTDFPYAPQVTYSFDSLDLAQQVLTIGVQWLDAAGNYSEASDEIWYDTAAPDLQTFQTTTDEGPAGTLTFYVGAYEEASGVAAVRFSTNGGSSWGTEIPMANEIVVWNPRDPSVGGEATALGARTVHAQVRDGTGQWSNVRSLSIVVAVPLSIGVSSSPTTGQPITFSADWSGPVKLPTGAMCLWEFMWGDDASIYLVQRNETFGYVMTQGPATAGFCDHWTFTLPWTPVRQYHVSLRVMEADWTDLGSDRIGSSPDDMAFTSAVGSTSRSITASNLPMFYVLPDAYELKVGEAAVYRGYAVGGSTIKSTDEWSIQYENTPERHPGSAVLTFYPKTTGYITVCLSREYSAGRQLGACFDPPVRRGTSSTGGGGGATPPPAAESAAPSPSGEQTTPVPTGLVAPTPTATAGEVAVANPSLTAAPAGVPPDDDSSPARNSWTVAPLTVAVIIGAVVLAVAHPRVRGRLRPVLRRLRPPGG